MYSCAFDLKSVLKKLASILDTRTARRCPTNWPEFVLLTFISYCPMLCRLSWPGFKLNLSFFTLTDTVFLVLMFPSKNSRINLFGLPSNVYKFYMMKVFYTIELSIIRGRTYSTSVVVLVLILVAESELFKYTLRLCCKLC